MNMKLPYGQDEVIDALLKAVPDTVVCMYAGAPVEMPWAEKAKAILWSYYAGMEGGTALAEILSGKVNPSGKLAETFIRDASQCPAHTIGTFGKKDRVEYREGVMVGYRYYDTKKQMSCSRLVMDFPIRHLPIMILKLYGSRKMADRP